MSSDKKNIDELFKEKLANNSVPYNDSYWENAQQAFKQFEAAEIASNSTMAIKTVVALAQKAFIMVGLIGFLLAIGSDFNKSSLSATKYEETTTASSVLASSQKNDKNLSNPIKSQKTKVNNFQNAITQNTQSLVPENKTEKSIKNTESLALIQKSKSSNNILKKKNKVENNTPMLAEVSGKKGDYALVNQQEKLTGIETQVNEPQKPEGGINYQDIAKLPMYGLVESMHNQTFNQSAKTIENTDKNYFLQLGVNGGIALHLKQHLSILDFGLAARLNFKNGLSVQSGFGVQQSIFEKNIATKYINEIKEIVKIPVPEWTYFENTKTVWGVYFNQGVAFTDSVEVSYTDSTISYVYHEKTNIIKDTVTSSQTITGTIQYFDIPLQIHYTKPLGKVSVGAFAGARFGILNKSKVLVNTDFKYAQPPQFRVGFETGIALTYWIKNNISLCFTPAYYQTSVQRQKFKINQVNIPQQTHVFNFRLGLLFDL